MRGPAEEEVVSPFCCELGARNGSRGEGFARQLRARQPFFSVSSFYTFFPVRRSIPVPSALTVTLWRSWQMSTN